MATKQINPSVQCEDYKELQCQSKEAYDAFYGEVRNETRVPRLTGQTDGEYKAYVGRAPYTNAVEQSVQSFLGTLMRNPFTLTGATEDQILVDEELTNLNGFLQNAFLDVSLGGHILVGIDINDAGQPFLTYATAEDVINWCDQFIILECDREVPNPMNPYEMIEETYWKELCIPDATMYPDIDPGLYGTFCSREWKKDGKKFVPGEMVQFQINGNSLGEIPYKWVNAYDNSDECYKPLMSTIAQMNIAHFRLSCDYYHGLHYLALPTFTITGELYRDQNGNVDGNIELGSTKKALHLEKDGKAQFVEFSGAGLTSIKDEKDKLETLMEQLSYQLTSTKSGVESADAMNMRMSSETSSLETITNAMENALNYVFIYYGFAIGKTISIQLNTNFIDTIADGTKYEPEADSMLTVLTLAQKGVISNATALQEAKNRGLVDPNVTALPDVAPAVLGQPRQVTASI